MKLILLVVLTTILFGCQTGVGQNCADLVNTANKYCAQFSEDTCDEDNFEHTTAILRNPIPCGWDDSMGTCIALEGCD